MKTRLRPFPRAFTMIEILMAISIIAILAGMLFVAMGHMGSSAKQTATRTTLANAKALLDEYNSSTGLKRQPGYYLWWPNVQVIVTSSTPRADFWINPHQVPNKPPEALDAPGLVTPDDPGARNGSRAVVNTLLAMSMLSQLPANRAAIAKLPVNHLFVPECVATQAFPGPGADGIIGSNVSPDLTEAVTYVPGCHVKVLNPSSTPPVLYYVCIATSGSTILPVSATPDWRDETAAPQSAPLLLDDWGNPIIFVPGSGLGVRLLNGLKTNSPGDNSQSFIIVSPEGKVGRDNQNLPYVIQPGRPFFASAGPDGDFSKGDDNLYSFDQ